MTAKKLWMDLTPATRAKRLVPMLNNHVPATPRKVVPQMVRHSKCADGPRCTGPGCRVTR